MKLHLATAGGQNIFTSYGPGFVSVNGVRYEKHIVVMSGRIMEWPIGNFEMLAVENIEFLLTLQPEIVILGTGNTQRFPSYALSRPLTQAGIGIEVMDTGAACRTYNILMAESRKVVAAVLVPRVSDGPPGGSGTAGADGRTGAIG